MEKVRLLKWGKRLCLGAGLLLLLGLVSILAVNAYVKHEATPNILSLEETAALENVDCILVLGCGLRGDRPSPMLADRLETGLALYQQQVAPKLLMSGDHGRAEYDEVNVMKSYALEAGVPSQDVFMDHAGFSTYESLYRARDIFCAKRVIVVSQEYHLYRALYIAKFLGLEAYGVAADGNAYSGQAFRDLREVLARCKDFCYVALGAKPTYLGEAIPISGDGDLSNG